MMNEGLLLHYLTYFTTIMHITVVTTAVAATATANVLYEHPLSKKDQQVIQVMCQVYFTHLVVVVVELVVVVVELVVMVVLDQENSKDKKKQFYTMIILLH